MRSSRLKVLLAGIALLAGPVQAVNAEPRHHALVIGIDKYGGAQASAVLPNEQPAEQPSPVATMSVAQRGVRWHPKDLSHAAFDAKGIADFLKTGMDGAIHVVELIGAADGAQAKPIGNSQVVEAWNKILTDAKTNDTVTFYFAGHGVEVGGTNYLLTSNSLFDPADLTTLDKSAVSLHNLLFTFGPVQQEKKLTGIFIIDACRNDPTNLEKNTNGIVGPMGPVQPPPEVFVIYSAGIGQEAADGGGEGGHSLFTSQLIEELKNTRTEPNISLSDLAERIQRAVYIRDAAWQKQENYQGPIQTPAYYSQMSTSKNFKGDTAQQPAERPNVPTLVDPKNLAHRSVFIECTLCPEMIVLQPEEFYMGAEATVAQAMPSERPAHPVPSGKKFAIGRYEVTRGEWDACVEAGDCKSALQAPKRIGARLPAAGINWSETRQFLNWLNKQKAKNPEADSKSVYRLPTEAEWEYAARGGEKRASLYAYGNPRIADAAASLCDYANGSDRSTGFMFWTNHACDDKKGRGTTQVGSFKPNAFGLHDMHGNVWEWVQDCWHSSYEQEAAKGLALEVAWEEQDCHYRVARGGSWLSGPSSLRSTVRAPFSVDDARSTIGFRVVREID